MVRLFIALLLPTEIKSALSELIGEFKPLTNAIKWVSPGNIHLTLKFIGERPEKDIGPISEVVREVTKGRKKIEAQVINCGGFPNLNRPRVIWVGMEGIEPAAEISGLINRKLVPLGIEAEKREFSAHLTLGRLKKSAQPHLPELTEYMEGLNFDAGVVILDRVALVKSTLTPQGPIYKNLEIYELE